MSRVKRGEARVHRLARVLLRQAVAGGRVPHRSESRALVGRLASIAMRGPQSVRQSVRDPYRLPTRPPSVSQLGDPRGQRFPIGAEI